MPSLRLACVQSASPKKTGLSGAPPAPLVVLAEYSNPSEQDSNISLDNSDVPSGLLASSEKNSDDECREEVTPAGGCNALACGCHMCMGGTLRVSTVEVSYPVPASGCHALACGNPASGCNAPASGGSCEAPEPHQHQKRSPFCGSRAMGGVDFDGSPISETDEEAEHVPGDVLEYHEIWDHEGIPLEHEIVDQSSLPPGYRFASGLSREELGSRYQFRGNGIIVDSADTADAYIHSSAEAELLRERYCAVLEDRTQAPPP